MKSGSWTPGPPLSRRKQAASNDPIASSGGRRRDHAAVADPVDEETLP